MSDHTTDTPLKRCSKCGELKPATPEYFHRSKKYKSGLNFACKSCKRIEAAAYYASHKQKVKAQVYAWRASHPDKPAEYYKANREKWRAYYCANREARVAYLEANRESIKAQRVQYRKANRAKRYTGDHRRRARQRNLPATFTATDWKYCLEYFGHCCAVCGRPRGLWHTLAQDHWIPVSNNGAYTPDNIVPLCHGIGGCNTRKRDRDAHEWLIESFGVRKARQIERRIREYFEHVAQIKVT